jgi:hypothetical protein
LWHCLPDLQEEAEVCFSYRFLVRQGCMTGLGTLRHQSEASFEFKSACMLTTGRRR